MFNAQEVLQIAVRLEENARAFYLKAADTVHDQEAKKLFFQLADWEISHINHFTNLKESLTGALAEGTQFDPNGEAALYLQAIADGKIFKIDEVAEDFSVMVEDAAEIIHAAIEREKDSVIFYQALLEIVPEGQGREHVKEIIAEEMSHVRYLASLADTVKR
ncbi:MAG: ferritin family protein [bacterium]|nr:ferritin family protein [bacterium]